MAIVGLIVGAVCGLPFWLPGSQLSLGDPWLWFALPFCGLGLWLFAYSLWFAVAIPARITFTRSHVIYRGLRKLFIAWSDIEQLRLDYAGTSPFVYLRVRTRAEKWHRLDVSGLTPNYKILFAVAQRLATSGLITPPTNLGLTTTLAQQISNLLG